MTLRWLLTRGFVVVPLILNTLLLRWYLTSPSIPLDMAGYETTGHPFVVQTGPGVSLLCTTTDDCALLSEAAELTQTTGCMYSREAFDTIRHQSRLARQAGRHARADILDYCSAVLRCQGEAFEPELAEAMSKVWNR